MAQEFIKINGIVIPTPSTFEPNWATTYTEDSGRVMSGQALLDPLFTVESFNAEWGKLTYREVSDLLKLIVPTPSSPNFELHYFSPYYGEWRTNKFYVGQGTIKLRTLKDYDESYKGLSCNFIGVNPII